MSSEKALGIARGFMAWLCQDDESCDTHKGCAPDGDWSLVGPNECEALDRLVELIAEAEPARKVNKGRKVKR